MISTHPCATAVTIELRRNMAAVSFLCITEGSNSSDELARCKSGRWIKIFTVCSKGAKVKRLAHVKSRGAESLILIFEL
jgi:hypothetical protein